jgi:hypothetical protein
VIHIKRLVGSLFYKGDGKDTDYSTDLENRPNPRKLALSDCTPEGSCDVYLGNGQWSVIFENPASDKETTLTHVAGQPYIDIQADQNNSTFKLMGKELVQSKVHLDHVLVQVNNGPWVTYPKNGSTCGPPCELGIYITAPQKP